jgi:hypothetical protein
LRICRDYLAVIGEYLFAPGEIVGNEVDAIVNPKSPQLLRDVLSFEENFLGTIGQKRHVPDQQPP